MAHALNWFEIPVNDLDRAARFYNHVLATQLAPMPGIPEMLTFPSKEGEVSGAIIKGEDYTPGQTGVVIYLNAGEKLSETVGRVEAAGGNVAVPQIDIGENGVVAFIVDTEGNRIGLHAKSE